MDSQPLLRAACVNHPMMNAVNERSEAHCGVFDVPVHVPMQGYGMAGGECSAAKTVTSSPSRGAGMEGKGRRQPRTNHTID